MKMLILFLIVFSQTILHAEVSMLAPKEFGPIKSIISDGRSTCISHAELSCFGNNNFLQNALPILSSPQMIVVGLNTTLVIDNGRAVVLGELSSDLQEIIGSKLNLSKFVAGKIFQTKTTRKLNLCLTTDKKNWVCIDQGQNIFKIENINKLASNDNFLCFQKQNSKEIECYDGENTRTIKNRIVIDDLAMTNHNICWSTQGINCQNLENGSEISLKNLSAKNERIIFLGQWSNGLCLRSNFSFGNGDFDIACYNSQLNRQRFIKQETTQKIEAIFAASSDLYFLEKHLINKKLRVKQIKNIMGDLAQGARSPDLMQIIPLIGQYEYYEKYPTGTLGHITFGKDNFFYDSLHVARSLYAQEGKSLKKILEPYPEKNIDNDQYHFMLYLLRTYLSEYGSYAATLYYGPQLDKKIDEENVSTMIQIPYTCQTHQLSLMALTELTGLAKEYFTQFEQWESFKTLRMKLAKAYIAGCNVIPEKIDADILNTVEKTAIEINKSDDFRHISTTLLLISEYLKVQQ